jgi:hypothetical protein
MLKTSFLQSSLVSYHRCRSNKLAGQRLVELEIRIRQIPFDTFLRVLNELPKHTTPLPPLSALELIISKSPAEPHSRGAVVLQSNRIMSKMFVKGELKKSDNWIKRPITRVGPTTIMGVNVIISVASEENDRPFAMNEANLARMKWRISFQFRKDWRIDLTVSRTTEPQEQRETVEAMVHELKALKELLTAELLVSHLRLKRPDRAQLFNYEIEMEYCGDAMTIDSDELNECFATIMHIIEPTASVDSTVTSHQLKAEVASVAARLVAKPWKREKFANGQLGFKQLSPQLTTLTRSKYFELFPPVGSFITPKADGWHAMLTIHDGQCYLIAEQHCQLIGPIDLPRWTIFEGEWLPAASVTSIAALTAVPKQDRLLIFDVCMLDGNNTAVMPTEQRLGYLERAAGVIKMVNNLGKLQCQIKSFHKITDDPLAPQIDSVYKATKDYEIDGIVFYQPGLAWAESEIYKWKLARDTTIDFLVKKAPANLTGGVFERVAGAQLYLLFAGINPSTFHALNMTRCMLYGEIFAGEDYRGANYFPIQFQTADLPASFVFHYSGSEPIANEIVEMRLLSIDQEKLIPNWEVVKIRTEKREEIAMRRSFGNQFTFAEVNWTNCIDPLTYEDLSSGPTTQYFASRKLGIYDAQTHFISYAKSLRIQTLRGANWAIDLGAGKGQDLGRFLNAGIPNLIAVDTDKTAIAELARRRFDHIMRRADKHQTTPPMAVYTLVADLTTPYLQTVRQLRKRFENIPDIGVDAITMNLALHYFAGSVDSLTNIAKLCSSLLCENGRAIFTIPMGNAIFELLRQNHVELNATFDIVEQDQKKYSIRREFTTPTMTPAGQMVAMIHPFSNGHYYSEYLVNTITVSKIFKTQNLHLIETMSYADLLNKTSSSDFREKSNLTDGDRQYIGLYGELIFKKMSKKAGAAAVPVPEPEQELDMADM